MFKTNKSVLCNSCKILEKQKDIFIKAIKYLTPGKEIKIITSNRFILSIRRIITLDGNAIICKFLADDHERERIFSIQTNKFTNKFNSDIHPNISMIHYDYNKNIMRCNRVNSSFEVQFRLVEPIISKFLHRYMIGIERLKYICCITFLCMVRNGLPKGVCRMIAMNIEDAHYLSYAKL